MNTTRVASCLLVLCSWQVTLAEESPLLWKFKVDDEHHYRMTQNMEMTMSMAAGNQIETKTKQIMHLVWKVESVDESGNALITQRVLRAQMDMQAPGQQEMHLDTDSEEAPTGFGVMLAPLYKAMTAEPFKITMTPRGEIKDAEIPESITKALENLPGAAMMGEMFSEEGFKNMTQTSSLVLPAPEDLKVGHKWSSSASIQNPTIGNMTTKSTYEYLGPKKVQQKTFEAFGFGVQMEFGEGGNMAALEISEQDSKGQILFSREEGRLESTELQQNADMSITAAGQKMTQKLKQTMTFERIENDSPGE